MTRDIASGALRAPPRNMQQRGEAGGMGPTRRPRPLIGVPPRRPGSLHCLWCCAACPSQVAFIYYPCCFRHSVFGRQVAALERICFLDGGLCLCDGGWCVSLPLWTVTNQRQKKIGRDPKKTLSTAHDADVSAEPLLRCKSPTRNAQPSRRNRFGGDVGINS